MVSDISAEVFVFVMSVFLLFLTVCKYVIEVLRKRVSVQEIIVCVCVCVCATRIQQALDSGWSFTACIGM